MIVSRRAVDAFLARPLDSWHWMKRLGRDEVWDALMSLRTRPRFRTDPWLHQLVCTYVGICVPEFLFLLDMGLGKSKILLDVLDWSIRAGRTRRGLVVVPRTINVHSWGDAVADHSSLAPGLVAVPNVGEKRELLTNPRGEVTVVDLAGLTLACTTKERGRLVPDWDAVDRVADAHGFVALDESHKVATDDSLWFAILDRLMSRAALRYAATGTLIGKRVERAWPQFRLVDRGATLGEDKGPFLGAFFRAKQGAFKQTLEFDKKMARRLHLMLQHRSIRYEDDEVHDLPMLVRRTRYVPMAEEQATHYANAVDGIVQTPAGARRSSPWVRMRQVVAGYVAWGDEYGRHVQRFDRVPKLDMLEEMVVDELADDKVIVVHHYTETGALVRDRLAASGVDVTWLHGATRDKAAARRRFVDDPDARVLLLNDDFGTGVDELQHAARYMVMYESPTAPDTRRQVVKRIHRAGQRGRCYVYDIVATGTVDAGILASIDEGVDLERAILRGDVVGDRVRKLLGGG